MQDAKGYFQEHPSRERKEAIVTRPLGPPPTHLDANHKKIWRELAKQVPPGVAKYSDRLMFENLVRVTVKMRNGTSRGVDIQQLITICSHFGMSPVARMRVGAVAEQPKDEMDEFLHKPKPRKPASKPVPAPDATIQ